MTTSGDDHQRLAAAIEARKREIRREWGEIAQAAGISSEHLRKFRRGETRLRPATQAGLEVALEWPTGAFDRIIAGERPLPPQHDQAAESRILAVAPRNPGDPRDAVVRLLHGGTVIYSAPSDASVDEVRETMRRLDEVLQEMRRKYGGVERDHNT